MFFVVEVIDQLKQVLLVQIFTVGVDVAQQFNLVNTLVKVVFVILDDFHADHLLSMDVVTLDSL